MAYTIGKVAALSKVSKRALHHYDAIGLLSPSRNEDNGYRLYTRADLQQLQHIMLYRSLGFSLQEIRTALNAPNFNFPLALVELRKKISQESAALKKQLELIDTLLNQELEEGSMDSAPTFTAFDNFNPDSYEHETQVRWGESEAYAESQRRTKHYTNSDWEKIKLEQSNILNQLGKLLKSDVKPTSKEAISLVDQYRLFIDHWFYPCSKQKHAELGKLYVTDSRFKKNLDKIQPNLSEYIANASAANAAAS